MTDPDKAAKAAVKDIIQGRTRLLTGTRDEIVRLLKEALARIQTLLAGQPSDYQLWSLPRLQAEIRQQLNAFGVDASATMATAAGRAWESGQGLIEKPLEAAGLSLAGRLPALDTGQLLAMRAFMTDRITDISLTAANQINSELGLVAIGAQGPGDAVGAITRILGEKARDRATTIVRTELGRVFSTAAHARLQQAGEAVPGLKKQWRRSGKIHSRPAHDAADGHVVERDQPFIINGHKLMYPHDPKAPASETINCGCVMLPYMDEWKDAGALLHPAAKPFTAEEIAANPKKAERATWTAPNPAKPAADAYETAKAGGRHKGLYRHWEGRPTGEIRKSIDSLRAQADLHQDKIANPNQYIDWPVTARERQGLVERYWPKEVLNFRQESEVLEGILRERGHE